MTGRFVALALVCAIAVGGLGGAARGHAQPAPSRVAVVRSSSDDRLLRDAGTRLRAELTSAGFEVIDVDSAPGDARAEVEGAVGASGSFATVALNRAAQGAFADVWISDHVTGKTVVRRLEVGEAANASAVLAIRALELLRASLLEIAAPPRASEPALAPAADVVKWVEPVLPRAAEPPPRHEIMAGTALGVSVLGLHGLRGVGPALGPSLRVSQGFARHWFGRLDLAATLIGTEIERPQGSVSMRQTFAALELGFATDARPLGMIAWVGGGAFDLHASGSAAPRYRSLSDDLFAFMANAGVGALWRLGPRFAVTTELGVLWLLPQPVVVVADDDAGRAGAPSLSLALGIVLGL